MIFTEYLQNSKRTFVELDPKLDLAHLVIGMNTEISELHVALLKGDVINIGEEIADMMWYISNYIRVRNLYKTEHLDMLFPVLDEEFYSNSFSVLDNKDHIVSLYSNISNLQDVVKKFIAYNKLIKVVSEELYIGNVVAVLASLCSRYGINMGTILEQNINKLKVRFPENFDPESFDDLAQNRDLTAEEKTLGQ